jgi:hypothetical protein
MHIREAHSLSGQAIGVRRGNSGERVIAVEIAPPEIVGEYVDNIGTTLCRMQRHAESG